MRAVFGSVDGFSGLFPEVTVAQGVPGFFGAFVFREVVDFHIADGEAIV